MESNRSSSRLKQRLVRMLKPSSLLRSSCNGSISAATNLSSTGSSRTLLRDVHREPVFVPGHHRHQGVDDDVDGMFLARDSLGPSSSFSIANDRRHAAPVLRLSIDCGGCRPTRDNPPLMAKRHEKGRRRKNKKKERKVRETGGFYETGKGEGRMCLRASPSSPSKSSCYYHCLDEAEKEGKKEEDNKRKQQQKKKWLSNSYGFSSSSSMDSDDGFEFFTSEERQVKEETEAFFSSRSFSPDSSEFYQRPNNNKKNKIKKPTPCPPRRRTKNQENRIASKGFQPLVSIASREKKVRESEEEEEEERVFAVVKRSRDPYGDFRSSMVEMIMERQIFGAEDLEKLLHYYLALNSPRHHPNILQAFSDIWVVLFGN